MKAARIIPSASSIAREALLVIAGAVLAAFIVGRFPALRRWIAQQWGEAQH